jgi:hypothetical protein
VHLKKLTGQVSHVNCFTTNKKGKKKGKTKKKKTQRVARKLLGVMFDYYMDFADGYTGVHMLYS